MTAPFSPHPPPILWLIILGAVASAFAMPFGRRDDLLGWLSLGIVGGAALMLWILLGVGAVRAYHAWYRDKPIEPDDTRVGECYTDHVYRIAWDHSGFSLLTHSGKPVVHVPLPKILDVIDIEALLIHGDVTVRTETEHVAFPKSRSERLKIDRLIGDLASSEPETQFAIECQRAKFVHQFCIWLPGSILMAASLLLPVFAGLEPQRLNLFWAVMSMVYGLGWWWVIGKFAYAVASLFAARRLQRMLR